MFFDECEICQHAHMVFRAVALVEVFQVVAREVFTFEAKANETFPYQITVRLHVDTVLATRQTTGTILLVKSLSLQMVLHC